MTSPEAKARNSIDAKLRAAKWAAQDKDGEYLSAERGIVVREVASKSKPEQAGYPLCVVGRAAGVIEASQSSDVDLNIVE